MTDTMASGRGASQSAQQLLGTGDAAFLELLSMSTDESVTSAARDVIPTDGVGDRVEELTFHFSSSAELGDDVKVQHDEEMAETRTDVGLTRVSHVLRLMAGEYGAGRLMDIGRRAAREIELQGDALRLDTDIDDPVMRYAVLELIKGSHLEGNAQATKIVDEKLQALYRTDGRRIRAAFNIAEAAFDFSVDPAKQAGFRRLYFDAIDLNTSMTARFLFNGLMGVVGVQKIDGALASMSVALRDDLLAARTSVPRDHLARMLSYLELFSSARVAQSMVAFARELLSRFRPGGAVQAKKDGEGTGERGENGQEDEQEGEKARELELSLTKELFNLGTSTVPGPLVDKLTDTFAGKEKERRVRFLNGVYRQSHQWPTQVWASEDAKNAVHSQLRRRLDQMFDMRRQFFR